MSGKCITIATVWPKEVGQIAMQEGWDLFNADGTFAIQRIDDPEGVSEDSGLNIWHTFESDDAAMTHVVDTARRPKGGGLEHALAMWLHGQPLHEWEPPYKRREWLYIPEPLVFRPWMFEYHESSASQEDRRYDDVGAEAFAAWWGCDPAYDSPLRHKGDGYLFYNFANDGQDVPFLWKFLGAIDRTLVEQNSRQCGDVDTARASHADDIEDLIKLRSEVLLRLEKLTTS